MWNIKLSLVKERERIADVKFAAVVSKGPDAGYAEQGWVGRRRLLAHAVAPSFVSMYIIIITATTTTTVLGRGV